MFQSRWACSMGLPVWPPLSAATPALSWFCASGPQARQCPHDWLWASQTGRLRVAFWTQTEEFNTCRGESERGYPGGRSQVHGPWAAPWGVWTSCRCFQVQITINEVTEWSKICHWLIRFKIHLHLKYIWIHMIELFHLVWVLLFWSLPVILRFQMVEKAGNSSDKDAPRQSLPAVRTTVF